MTSGQLVFPGSRGLGSKVLAFGSPGHSFPEGNLPPALFPGDSPRPLPRTRHRPSRPPPIPPRGTGGSFNSRIPLPSLPARGKPQARGRADPFRAVPGPPQGSSPLGPALGWWVERGRPAQRLVLPGASPSELPPSCKLSFATFKKIFFFNYISQALLISKWTTPTHTLPLPPSPGTQYDSKVSPQDE